MSDLVMVIEDEKEIRDLLKYNLEKAGFRVATFADGDHPDGSPIRVGNDFYLTHSSFDYAPGLLIWHSKDLINWRPVAAALRRYYGTVWAPYLCEYQNLFYMKGIVAIQSVTYKIKTFFHTRQVNVKVQTR